MYRNESREVNRVGTMSHDGTLSARLHRSPEQTAGARLVAIQGAKPGGLQIYCQPPRPRPRKPPRPREYGEKPPCCGEGYDARQLNIMRDWA